MNRTSPTGKSCLECRRRKIKCDRILPCSYCVRVKVQCTFPPRKAVAGNGIQSLSDQELTTRVESIERTMKSVEKDLSQIWQLVQPLRSQPPHQLDNLNQTEASNVPGTHANSASNTQYGQLDPTSQEHSAPTLETHPSIKVIFLLWQIYLERVHPVLKIIHAPTVQRQIAQYMQDQGSDRSSFHCLLFAIYYAAVVTMPTDECKRVLTHDRLILLQRYRESLEMALSQAEVQTSKDMTVLQALTLYTVCGRFDGHGPDVKSLTRLAIRVAFENGLDEGDQRTNTTPFEAEMRRRLWWQIFVLDTRIAEDEGSEPRILESQFHSKFPSRISDADLDPDMSKIPRNQLGKSEMLFSLVRLETSYFTRFLLFSAHFTEQNSYPTMSTSREKCEALDRFKERLELEYLSHCDTSIPLDFLTAESSRLILAKIKLTVTKPRNREREQVLTQESFRETCVEILERAKALRLHERSRQWLWLFQSYIEWDALTYLFINLSLSPLGDGVVTAWAVAEDIFQYWNAMSDSRGCSRWRRIEEFHTQALTAREMAISKPVLSRASSSEGDRLEANDTTAMGSLEPVPLATALTGASEAVISPALYASQIIPRSESSMEPQQFLDQVYGNQNAQTAGESLDIPSSATACQWSAALFEQYFGLLDSEQDVAASWF